MKFVPTHHLGDSVPKYGSTTPDEMSKMVLALFETLQGLTPKQIEAEVKTTLGVSETNETTKQMFNRFLAQQISMNCGFREPSGTNANFDLIITFSATESSGLHVTELRVLAPKSLLDFLRIQLKPARPTLKADTDETIAIQLIAKVLNMSPSEYFHHILKERLMTDFDKEAVAAIAHESHSEGIYPLVAEEYLGLA